MAIASSSAIMFHKEKSLQIFCKKKGRGREKGGDSDQHQPYKVIEITPPPKNFGIRCFPPNVQNGECVTIEGNAYTVSSVTYRYQLRKGKYELSEKRLDVQSSGRYILNLYLESLLNQP